MDTCETFESDLTERVALELTVLPDLRTRACLASPVELGSFFYNHGPLW